MILDVLFLIVLLLIGVALLIAFIGLTLMLWSEIRESRAEGGKNMMAWKVITLVCQLLCAGIGFYHAFMGAPFDPFIGWMGIGIAWVSMAMHKVQNV